MEEGQAQPGPGSGPTPQAQPGHQEVAPAVQLQAAGEGEAAQDGAAGPAGAQGGSAGEADQREPEGACVRALRCLRVGVCPALAWQCKSCLQVRAREEP